MGISEALKYHEDILELKDNFSLEDLANGAINPTYRTVQYWHDEWRIKNLGPRSGIGMIEVGQRVTIVNIYAIIYLDNSLCFSTLHYSFLEIKRKIEYIFRTKCNC